MKTYWFSEISLIPLWSEYDVGIATSERSAQAYQLALFGRISRAKAIAILRLKRSREVEKLTVKPTVDFAPVSKAKAIRMAAA